MSEYFFDENSKPESHPQNTEREKVKVALFTVINRLVHIDEEEDDFIEKHRFPEAGKFNEARIFFEQFKEIILSTRFVKLLLAIVESGWGSADEDREYITRNGPLDFTGEIFFKAQEGVVICNSSQAHSSARQRFIDRMEEEFGIDCDGEIPEYNSEVIVRVLSMVTDEMERSSKFSIAIAQNDSHPLVADFHLPINEEFAILPKEDVSDGKAQAFILTSHDSLDDIAEYLVRLEKRGGVQQYGSMYFDDVMMDRLRDDLTSNKKDYNIEEGDETEDEDFARTHFAQALIEKPYLFGSEWNGLDEDEGECFVFQMKNQKKYIVILRSERLLHSRCLLTPTKVPTQCVIKEL